MRYFYFIIILHILLRQFIINNFDKFENIFLEIVITKNLFYIFMIIYLIFIIFNIVYWIYLIKNYSHTIIY